MPIQRIRFDKGLVTARSAMTLEEGELSRAVGCEYRVGSSELFKLPGRRISPLGLGASVTSLARLQYDVAADVFVVVTADGSLYEGTVPPTATNHGLPGDGMAPTLTGLDGDVGRFTAFRDEWIYTDGGAQNYIREAGEVPGGSTGHWRRWGIPRPLRAPTVSATFSTTTTIHAADASTGTGYINPELAYDVTDAGEIKVSTPAIAEGFTVGSKVTTWSFPTGDQDGRNNRVVRVSHAGGTATESGSWAGDEPSLSSRVTGFQIIEVSEDNGATWMEISALALPYHRRITNYSIANSTDIDTELLVRSTLKITSVKGQASASGLIYGIWVTGNDGLRGGITTYSTVDSPLYYCYTERYVDSQGVERESAPSDITDAITLDGTSGIEFSFPTRRMQATSAYVIYRSLDEQGGGYPNMYKVGEISTSDTRQALTWTDNFELALDSAVDKDTILPTLTTLFPNGAFLTFDTNYPPPASKLALTFDGAAVYVPPSSFRLFYSLPFSVTPAGAEYVPQAYYLEFDTPENDIIQTAVVAANGRGLFVYFERSTWVVFSLPQATDPGVFERRVREYISTQRGAVGTHMACAFTLPDGKQMAAAVDDLGMWVTDGSMVIDWSNDLDWDLHFSQVDLSSGELYNNPKMRRLELLYADEQGNRKEFHFFYGRLKGGADNIPAPIITGPHPAAVRSRWIGTIDGKWTAWSGGSGDEGNLFLERAVSRDDSRGYSLDGAVPFDVESGEIPVVGFSHATLVEFGYPQFERDGTANKNVTLVGAFKWDAGTALYITEYFPVQTGKKILWHIYSERHAIRIKDISASSLPPLIGYEVEHRDAGTGRAV